MKKLTNSSPRQKLQAAILAIAALGSPGILGYQFRCHPALTGTQKQCFVNQGTGADDKKTNSSAGSIRVIGLSLPAYAFFGLDKHKSKLEADMACDKWP